MKHEKIFKWNDGTETKVTAFVYVDHMRDEFNYSHSIEEKKKGKRKFTEIDEYRYNELIEGGLKHLINSAKNELWQKIKP